VDSRPALDWSKRLGRWSIETGMNSMKVSPTISARVIDTHVHVWNVRSPWMAWLEERPVHWDVVRRDFAWQDLRRELDQARVSEVILVQACTTPAETRQLLGIAERESSVLGVVGWASLKSGRETAADLALLAGPGANKLVGIRNNHRWKPDGDVIATPQAIDSCRLLAERRLPLDLHFPDYKDLPLAAKLVQQVPEGTYVIDHLGKPTLDDPAAFAPWASAMSILSEFPNVYVKYSGWATFVRRTLACDVQKHVDFVLDKFGSQRVMFGSNWPVALVAGSYEQTYRATLEAASGLSPEACRNVFCDTAIRCYLRPHEARP
jgi:L-fuconolactonase